MGDAAANAGSNPTTTTSTTNHLSDLATKTPLASSNEAIHGLTVLLRTGLSDATDGQTRQDVFSSFRRACD
jgi:hypothetical protein